MRGTSEHARRLRLAAGLLVALALSPLAGCGEQEPGRSGSAAQGALAPLGDAPEFALTDQWGAGFGRGDLDGQVWVADFVFTRCTTLCPRLTARMEELQEKLRGDPLWQELRLVSFSVDPEYDRPAVLAEYAEKHGADPDRWVFLTGGRDEIWALSKDGFKLAVGEDPGNVDEPLFHSPKFVLVDRVGRIRGYYDALDAEGYDTLVADLRRVAGEPYTAAAAPTQLAQVGVPTLPPTTVVEPPGSENPSWLASRAAAQREAAKSWEVFHGFRFRDERGSSGIDFLHRIVEDAGKAYKGVHYDHGNGVAIADVDGDGLHDIYFVNQLGANALWRNLGGARFEDVTAEAGVALDDRVCVSASFADTDNDGDADLYVTAVRGPNVLFLNDGKGRFQDASAASGLDYSGHSSGAVFFDYDRDGLLDLFLLNIGVYTRDVHGPGGYWVGFKDGFDGHLKPERSERSLLFHNQGGNRFSDVTDAMGLVDTRWSGDATPIDANRDGWIDLYVLNMQGLDGFYENVEGKRFVERTQQLFPRSSWGAMGVKTLDFDNDGDMDIFISDMHSDMSVVVDTKDEKLKAAMQWPQSWLVDGGQGIYGNTFFQAEADGSFVEVSDEIGAENFWPWGLSVADVNADGWQDAFVTSSMNYPFRYGINSLLLNDRGRGFLDAEFVLGIEPRADDSTVRDWFELDCAGEDRYHRNCPKGGAAGLVVVKGALGTRASVVFDVEGDGDLDIVTNEFNSEPLVLISNLSEQRPIHYLMLKPVGTRSNRDGLGARISVQAGKRTLTQVHDGLSGYLSRSSYPLYFGLGEAESVDEIRVTWPSGVEQKLAGPIEVDRLMEIIEPK